MPSMGWNVFHLIHLKTTEINIFGVHFGNVSYKIKLAYSYVSQNNFCLLVSSTKLFTAIWKVLLQWWACYYLYSSSSILNVQDLHLLEWGGSREYFLKWKYDKLPKITFYLSRTLVRAHGESILFKQIIFKSSWYLMVCFCFIVSI